jgi:N-acetylglucosaminyl-diphospho-decaprenol L-rhamnosyltransferase
MAGWRAAAAPDAVAVHLGSATLGHQRTPSQRRYGGFGRGYLLRRYELLRGRTALRTLITEALVVMADMLITRDLIALRSRVEGWRAGGGRPRLGHPPAGSVDAGIGFRDSLMRRWQTYGA